MAANNRNIRRGVEIYIDGKEVKANIKAIEAEARKLTKEIKGMTIGTEEYQKATKKLRELNIILAEHREAIRGVEEEQKGMLERTREWLGKWGGMLATIGAGITGLAMVISKFRKDLQEREDTKADVKALTGLDDESIDWLEKKAYEMSTTMNEAGVRVRESATEILDAFKLVGSAKPDLLQNKEALAEVTEQALTLATAAGMNLKDAVDAVTLSMNQYGAASNEAARYANVMAAGSKFGAAAVESVTTAVTKSGVAASTANVSIEELVGSIEAIAEKGIKDQVAGTGLKTFFLKLEKQAKDVRPSVVGLQTALENLAAKHLSAQEMMKMFGLEAYTVAQAMISSADKVKYYTEAVSGTETATEQAAIKSETAAAKLAQMKNELAETGMELAEKLGPIISKFVNLGGKFILLLPKIINLFAKMQGTLIALTAVYVAYTLAKNKDIIVDKLKVFWNDKLIKSFNKLFATIKKHPFALLAVALGAIIDVVRSLNRQLSEAERKQKALAEVSRQAKESTQQEIDKIKFLSDIIHDSNASYAARKKAIEDLQTIIPEYHASLTREGKLINDNVESIDRYIRSITLRAQAEVAGQKLFEAQAKKIKWDDEKQKNMVQASQARNFAANGNPYNGRTYDSGEEAAMIEFGMSKTAYRALIAEYDEYKREIAMYEQMLHEIQAKMKDVYKETANAGDGGGGGGKGNSGDINNKKDPEAERRKRVRERLAAVDAEYNKKAIEAKQKYLAGDIKTEQEYNDVLRDIEIARLKAKMQVEELTEAEQNDFLSNILDMEVGVLQQINTLVEKSEKKNAEEELEALADKYDNALHMLMDAYEKGIIPSEEKYMQYREALMENYGEKRKDLLEKIADEELKQLETEQEQELAQLKLSYANKLMTEEAYQKAVLAIREKYNKKKLEVENKSKDAIVSIASETIDIETEKAEKAQKEIEKQADKVKEIANEVSDAMSNVGENIADALFGDDQKEAWKKLGKEFLKDALSIVEKYILIKQAQIMANAVAEATTIAGAAKAIISATAKMAAIKAAFGLAKGAINNFYDGGFTAHGRWNEPQGVVHSDEFVANRFATGNPSVLPVLKLIDAAQRAGTIANLSGSQIAAVASGRVSANTPSTNVISSSEAAPDMQMLVSVIAKLDKTMQMANEAYKTPSPAYCFTEGKGGINEAMTLNRKLKSNAAR